MLYFVVFLFLIILAIRYDIQGKTKYREEWYFVLLVVFVLIAGLRWRFAADTVRYMHDFYHNTPEIWNLTFDTFLSSGSPPLWILLNSIVKSIGGKFFLIQLIQATIVDTLFFKYFKKHSSYPFACLVLFFFWRYQYFNMMIMKAAVALSIIMFANDYLLQKKYLKWFFLILIATGFHQSSILLLVTPFVLLLRFNMFGVMVLVGTYFVGMILQNMLGDIFEMLEFVEGISNKLNSYMEGGDFMTQTRNINYFILAVFPVTIYPILSLLYVRRKCKNSPILKLEPFVMLGLVFQVMQFNIHIFYRYTYICYVYYMIFIVHFFMDISQRPSKLKLSLSYIRAFVVVFPFIASLYIRYRPFTTVDYNPYSSVIERSTDKEREKYYLSVEGFPRFAADEY